MDRFGIPSLMPAIGMGCGIWLAYGAQPQLYICLAAFLVSAGLLGVAVAAFPRIPSLLFTGLSFTAFAAFGAWVMAKELPLNQPGHYNRLMTQGRQRLVLELKEPLKPTSYSKRWTAEVRRAGTATVQGRILLQVPLQTRDSLWLPGDYVLAGGQIKSVPGPLNPHQFDYAAYLRTIGIYGQLRLESGRFLHTAAEHPGLASKLARMRRSLLNKVYASGLSPESASMLAALVLGDRTRLDQELYASYQRAGAVHLLAVSGLHVGVLMGLAAWLLRPLARRRGGSALRMILILLCLWFYAFLAGFGASVVRASLLFSFVGYAHLTGRGREGPHILGLAALVMLGLIDPLWLFQPGFQLSFAAVWAIYAFYPAMMRRWPWKRKPGRSVGELLCLGNAAQLGVLPISLYYFHQFPLLYWAANLFIVPVMGIVLVLGLILVCCIAASWLPSGPATLFEWALAGINTGVRRIASVEAGLVTGIRWSAVELVLLSAALLLGSVWLARGGRWRLRLAAGCVLALQGWQLQVAIQSFQKAEWVVPQRTAATGFWVREGPVLKLFCPEPEAFNYAVRDYTTAEGIRDIRHDSLQPAYRLGENKLWVLGPGNRYPHSGMSPDILLLSGSPKVHLERVLQKLQPGLVIADGSNYRSFAARWAASCRAYGIPFHNTAEKGAYRAGLSNINALSPSGALSAEKTAIR